jgi:MOSC domain-containing protein YiiM
MRIEFKVESVNISKKKGVQKHAVEEIELIVDLGIKGDAHAGKWHRQVSFLAGEGVDKMKAKGLELQPGAFGENVVTRGFDWSQAKVGGKIYVNDLILEITQIGKECHDHCAIYEAAGECIMPTQGIFVKVIKGGRIRAQDSGYYSI